MSNSGKQGGRWGWPWLLLVAPFLCVAWATAGFDRPMVTFHWTDEALFHLPAIRKLAAQWPQPDLHDYSSATTPLFHLFFAGVSRALGEHLPWMRAINVVISLLAIVVYRRILVDRTGLDRQSAHWASLAFGLSPYFFGVSFILLTDNMAWLWCMLTIWLATGASGPAGRWHWWGACFCLMLGLLTRQTNVWLVPILMVLVWRDADLTWPQRWGRLLSVGLALLPTLALFALWKGPVPPSFQQVHEASSGLNGRALQFMMVVLGFYFWVIRVPVGGWKQLPWWESVAPMLLGTWVLWLCPFAAHLGDDGFLWRLSTHMPVVHGTSVLFWVLLPCGLLAGWQMLRSAPFSVGTVGLMGIAPVLLRSELLYQKYFDPFLPVFLTLSFAHQWPQPLDRMRHIWALLSVAGLIYLLLPAFHF
jgi:4-amino-4-deoxy-L-arabinose transferase-like glycosyltransferase